MLQHLTSLRAFAARIRDLVSRGRLSRELDDELAFHLEAEIAHNVARGMSPAEARRVALASFGGVQQFREATREARGFASMDTLGRDARLAVRRLRRTPAFSLGVVGTLALGVGAATGIGAIVHGVVLRPLPYPDPDRVVRLSLHTPQLGLNTGEHSSGTYVYFAERARSFATLGAYLENDGIGITDGDAPERVSGVLLTPNILTMLGVAPVVGRLLNEEDAQQNPVPVLISHDLWERRFGGDPNVVERTIELNRSARRIVGVLPTGFEFPSRATSVYYPEHVEATRAGLTYRGMSVIGRLAPGVTLPQAQQEVDALIQRIHERFPELTPDIARAAGLSATVETERAAMVAPVRAELVLLAATAALLLLMTLANVTTLTLLRAERLRGEVSLARALGAGRRSLVQRFVVEGLVLAIIGASAAVPVVATILGTRLGFPDGAIPRLHEVGLTPGAIVVLLAVAGTTGVFLGLVATARTKASDAAEALRSSTRATRSREWRRAQEGLVALQVALAFALLLGAGLMTRSFARLRAVDLGFVPADGAVFSVALPFSGYSTFQRTTAFQLSLVDALRAQPGVREAAAVMQLPSTPQQLVLHPRLEARRVDGTMRESDVDLNFATPNYFQVMGIKLTAGRSFAPGDFAAATPGVVLSASLARNLFGGEDPIGREVRIAASAKYPPYRVVGVSGDVFGDRVANGPLSVMYFPLLGDLPAGSMEREERFPIMPGGMTFLTRSDLPLATLAPAFRSAVASIDGRVPLWDVRTLDGIVATTMARTRLSLLLLGAAAVATLLLGGIGLSSVMAYTVAGRVPEFAVRLALGATPAEVSRLTMREGAILTALGLGGGVLLSIAGGRILQGVLFGVSPLDPAVWALAALVVLVSAAAATWPSATRAGAGDPARLLRG